MGRNNEESIATSIEAGSLVRNANVPSTPVSRMVQNGGSTIPVPPPKTTSIAIDGHSLGTISHLTCAEVAFICTSGSGGYRCGMDDFNALAKAVSTGSLTCECVPYKKVKAPSRPPAVYEYRSAFDRTGGFHHSTLKWHAACWLRSLGSENVAFEVAPYGYGKCDVVSRELGIAVECGSVDAGDILWALEYTTCRSVAVFPFLDPGEEPHAYVFSRLASPETSQNRSETA